MTEPTGDIGWSDILDLVAKLDAAGFEDADITTDGVRVRVSRHALADTTPAPRPPAEASAPAAPRRDDPAGAAPPATPAVEPATDPAGLEVTASILGVLYLRPSPDAEPFVKVGDTVSPDTTVAVIEVMKMMNTLSAGVSGRIVEVCRPEGQMVEHGDVLFRVTAS